MGFLIQSDDLSDGSTDMLHIVSNAMSHSAWTAACVISVNVRYGVGGKAPKDRKAIVCDGDVYH